MKRRVVITGVGAITPIGIGKDEFWNNLVAGKSGVGPITQFDASEYGTRIAGEVKDFDFSKYGDKKEGKRMDRVTQFAVAAAKMAVEDAKLDLESIDPVRAGVCVGRNLLKKARPKSARSLFLWKFRICRQARFPLLLALKAPTWLL